MIVSMGAVVVMLCFVAGMVMALPDIDKGYWSSAVAYACVVLFATVTMIWGLS